MSRLFLVISIIFGIFIVIGYIMSEWTSISGGLNNILGNNPWTGTFYKSVNSSFSVSEKFKTSEECIQWADNEAKKSGSKEGEWSYTCGLNCNYKGRTPGSTVDNYECETVLPEQSDNAE